MKKVFSIISALIITAISVLSLIPQKNVKADNYYGDYVLEGGYVAHFIGFDKNFKGIYQTDFSAPEYLPDKVTKIDTNWKSVSGIFQSGANLLSATINGETVTVKDKTDKPLSWTPTITIANLDTINDKSGVKTGKVALKTGAKILSVDPINPNYDSNTIEWDYGNGILRRARMIEGMFQEYYVITQPIAADFVITDNATKDKDFKGIIGTPVAYDRDLQKVNLTIDSTSIKLTKETALDVKVKYPVYIDPDTSVTGTSSDGFLGENCGPGFWNNIHNDNGSGAPATVDSISSTASTLVSSTYAGGYLLGIRRSYLFFDTSGLSGYTITGARIQVYPTTIYISLSAWTMQVQNGMPTYPHDPLAVGDWDYTKYSGNGGQLASANMSLGTYNTINLNATGYGWINQTGTTKFTLKEVEHDINNSCPPNSGTFVGSGMVYYTYEQGAGYRPQLIVTYTSTDPSITTSAASNVAYSSARLNSNVISDGGENVTAWFAYGTDNISGNLLTNPSFESDLTGWVLSGVGATANNQTATVKVGSKALSLTRNGADASEYNSYASWATTVGNNVTIGAWVKSSTALSARIQAFDGVNNYVSSTHSGGGDWEWLQTSFTVAGGAGGLLIYAAVLNFNSTAYFDDYVMVMADNFTAQQGGFNAGDYPYADLTGLSGNTTYYFNAIAENTKNNVLGIAANFTTSTGLASVTGVSGNPTDTTIDLKWTKATGSTNTLVRYRADTYPTGIGDGTLAYLSTASSYNHPNLTSGKTYYYSLWGESGGVYSTNATHFTMTTLSIIAGTQTLDTPGMPFNFLSEPDYTTLNHIEPFYTLVNNVADSIHMPRNNFWTGLWLVGLALLGFGGYRAIRTFEAPALIIIAGGWLGVSLHLISGWIGLFLTVGAIVLYGLKSGFEFQQFKGE